MMIKPSTNNLNEYLKEDVIVNFSDGNIRNTADLLYTKAENRIDYIKIAFEFVRDRISHSADIDADEVTVSASEVLRAGHGICFAKSHLLAALLRCKGVPTGFCYQKLILDDETAPYLIFHGLNGVYIEELNKWIRIDARGNREGVDAMFSADEEHLAFPIRPEFGEQDGFTVYSSPDTKIIRQMKKYKSRRMLWDDLPKELENDL